jgi:enterochelin esterase family protein
MDVETYQHLGLDLNFTDHRGAEKVNGRSNLEIADALNTPGDVAYHPCPEAQREPDAIGTLHRFEDWRSSAAYPGTVRDVWLYEPASPKSKDPVALLVFNDGGVYLDPDGPVRAARVLDVLQASGALGPTAAVFVSPGRPLDVPAAESPWGINFHLKASEQRSIEYDNLTDTYARFVVDELLPFAQQQLGVKIDDDPSRRAMVGISSGGICAWTTAWHRPDSFGLVLSHCGSFVNIRGGHAWPYLVRSTAAKPIKVFLQSGELDANIIYGNWPLANKQMAAALQFAGYDVRFEFGTGGHNLRHAGALFAKSLRWLFTDSPETKQGAPSIS